VSGGVLGYLWVSLLFGLVNVVAGTILRLLTLPLTVLTLGLSLLARFQPFAVGAMYASDFGFFLAVTLLGLFLAVRGLARR